MLPMKNASHRKCFVVDTFVSTSDHNRTAKSTILTPSWFHIQAIMQPHLLKTGPMAA